MVIRPMEEADIPFVHEMECRIFSRPWSKEDFSKSIQEAHNIYLVVEQDSKIIAYCGLWGVAGEGQINNVAVDFSYRNKGVAREMLQTLISIGRSKELESFTLEVRVSNLSAIALYHGLGFQDAGIRKNFYEAPTEDGLIMWL
ncbi:MAG: ribosomal protein S18-alanine N-acetyltransferase [Anaerocolumna aminovalerica]|jgi:ribosomal-protein-alanine N-acetyltransferase|uniref:ribosomal protein S18-alanine N-acetyltransferase n=1 Tax=Anaerocolumna aminovalerica TaxID=1527 RepID=UPI00290EE556|nr:ribosomal protein S18-alanine N-acetyltransferase [Anaerocolumna aminovalerica]MDU6266696.1 ribosomal protein S18-alanine N-acetyltransferase [Anaerocolumna aminovalerica]